METGASLDWLVYGRGEVPDFAAESEKTQNEHDADKKTLLRYTKIQNGVIHHQKQIVVSTELIPVGTTSPQFVSSDGLIWVVDDFSGELVDGFWMVEMDGVISIREIYRLPGGRVRVENGKASFECSASDMKVLGKVVSKTELLNA